MRTLVPADHERGSIALSILLVVMVSALLPVVLATTLAEQRVTRKDRDSGIALEAADAGLQDARYRLINRVVQPTDPLPVTRTSTLDSGVPFTWSARPDPDSSAAAQAAGLSWLVVSRGGHPDGVQRTVRAYLTQQSLFSHGLFLNNAATLNGGNSVDSYSSTRQQWNTGDGVMATNGTLNIQGNVTADRVQVHDWTANPASGRCTASGNSGPLCVEQPASGPTATAKRSNIGPRFPLPQQVPAVQQVLATASATCPASATWRSSVHGGSGTVKVFSGPPGVYCFDSIRFDRDTVLPATGEYRIYVRGTITVDNGVRVNCSGCSSGEPATKPTAGRLLLLSPTTGVALDLGNHAHVAAGIYAPRGSCTGGAQADVYGSMLCETGGNVGGWSFHFDEDIVETMGTGEFSVTRWDESPGATVP